MVTRGVVSRLSRTGPHLCSSVPISVSKVSKKSTRARSDATSRRARAASALAAASASFNCCTCTHAIGQHTAGPRRVKRSQAQGRAEAKMVMAVVGRMYVPGGGATDKGVDRGQGRGLIRGCMYLPEGCVEAI